MVMARRSGIFHGCLDAVRLGLMRLDCWVFDAKAQGREVTKRTFGGGFPAGGPNSGDWVAGQTLYGIWGGGAPPALPVGGAAVFGWSTGGMMAVWLFSVCLDEARLALIAGLFALMGGV